MCFKDERFFFMCLFMLLNLRGIDVLLYSDCLVPNVGMMKLIMVYAFEKSYYLLLTNQFSQVLDQRCNFYYHNS